MRKIFSNFVCLSESSNFINFTWPPQYFCLLFLILCKELDKKTCYIFQICHDCDHEIMKIPKLKLLYQIPLSQYPKILAFLTGMIFNHEKWLLGLKCINSRPMTLYMEKLYLRMEHPVDLHRRPMSLKKSQPSYQIQNNPKTPKNPKNLKNPKTLKMKPKVLWK